MEVKCLTRATPAYSFITTLRLLLKLKQEGAAAKDILLLEHHTDIRERADPPTWRFHQKFVAEVLAARLPGRFVDTTPRQVHREVCRLRTNTLELNNSSSCSVPAVGLYPLYSLLNHSCMHNTRQLWFHRVARKEISSWDRTVSYYHTTVDSSFF